MRSRRDQPRWLRKLRVRTRRALHRWDRSAPAWIAHLPNWGASLLLHAVVLVILATAYLVAGPQPPGPEPDAAITALADEDVRSLLEADRSGDPFTTLQADEAPSLSLEPAPSSALAAQPNLRGSRFAPGLTMPDRTSAPRSDLTASNLMRPVRVHVEDMTAPFAGRSEATKALILRREGGTAASERAVSEGLIWLSRHQAEDGGWHLDPREECSKSPGCPAEAHAVSDTAATGLALLPFLGAGHIHTKAGDKYRETIRRGLDWLILHQQKTGELFLGGIGNGQMYSHAIASMALCEAYGLSREERLRAPAQLAIDYILMAQNKDDGGWRYYPGAPGDTSVLGWQMFALRSARLAGLDVSANALRGCGHFLDLVATDKYRTRYAYMPGRNETDTMSAEALLCRQYLGWLRDSPSMVKGVAGVWDDLQASNDRNIYYWYYATQLLHNMQNKAWKQWNVRVRDGLIAQQVSGEGCDRGSWSGVAPVPDRWGVRMGRLYQTSLSILTLEVYYRFLPLYRTDGPELNLEKP